MNKSIILNEDIKAYFSSHAALAALGRKMTKLKVFEPVAQKVKIAQKTVREIFKGIESGAEEVYPDKAALDFVAKLKTDAKGLEKEWSRMLPQPVEK